MAALLERHPSPVDFGAHDPFALVGEVVGGRFRVLALRHSGPRGLVYEVEPPGVGQMRRALKVLTLPEAREPDVPERLRTVVRGMREVTSTHVERVFDVGVLPDETPFVVTEWLPLPTLEARLSGPTRLPGPTAVAVLLRVVQAVAALHTRSIVHGDLRPAHVLLDLRGEEPHELGDLKVVDAGVPAVVNGAPSGGPRGSLAYLAPECLSGHGRTFACDVYALGVLGYRLLTHVLPYRPDDPRASSHDADPAARVRWLHQNASPVRPSKLVTWADFSPALEAVVGRAMAKSVSERHPDAQALLTALEEALNAPMPGNPGQVAIPRAPTPAGDLKTLLSLNGLVEPQRSVADGAQTPRFTRSALTSVASPPENEVDETAAVRSGPPLWAWSAAGLLTGVTLALLTR